MFSAKHLIGCPHILSWKGTIRYHRLLGRKTWAEFHCNSWAFHCRVVAGGEHTCGKSVIEVPSEFWKLLPKELFILSIKLPKTSIAVDDSMPIVVMELGTAPKTLVDDMVTSKKIRVAFVSENRMPKYVIIFRYVEGKIHGAIVRGPRVMDSYKVVRLKCFEMSAIEKQACGSQ